jgi:Uma2 family endonuclease
MAAPAHVTATAYFALDEASETRHELVEGEVYAMAGGSPNHARLSSRIGQIVGPQVRGRSCDTYSSDLRVALTYDTYAYPDHTVVCGPPELHPENRHTVVNPRVVFEVLSPETEDYDRGRKSTLYRRIPSLQSVVLIAQDKPEVETYERQPDGSWVWRIYSGAEQVVPLPSVDAKLPLTELYAGIDFPA